MEEAHGLVCSPLPCLDPVFGSPQDSGGTTSDSRGGVVNVPGLFRRVGGVHYPGGRWGGRGVGTRGEGSWGDQDYAVRKMSWSPV